MFNKKKSTLKAEILNLKGNFDALNGVLKNIKQDKVLLTENIAELKHTHKMEIEDIKHLVKLTEGRRSIELEKERLNIKEDSFKKIAEAKDEFRDKSEAFLEKHLKSIEKMYADILGRLPNYNVNHDITESQ